MISAFLASVLVLASLALLLFIISLLFNALHLPLGRVLERRRFTSLQTRSRRGDAYLAEGDVDRALREFRAAFFLHPIVSDRSLVSEVHNHHTGLLSRFITVTEELQGGTVRLMSLAKVDRLLAERGDLQRRYFASRAARDRNSDVHTLYRQLLQNARELQTCLKQLASEIAASRPVARYH